MAEIDVNKSLAEATDAVKVMQKSQEDFIKEQKEAATKSDNELKLTKEQYEQSKKELQETKSTLQKVVEAQDKLIAERKAIPYSQGIKSFGSELSEKLTARKADLDKFRFEKKGFGTVELETKTVGNMGSSANLTGSLFVAPTIIPGVVQKLYEQNHLRDILPVGQTDSNLVRYIQDNGGEGGPTTVAEAGTKPQIDRDLAVTDAPVRKIATYFRVPEEMINDIPYLSSFLTAIGLEEVRFVEDNQILYGDGTGQNLTGFNVAGTLFTDVAGDIVAAANEFDVIGTAKKQIRLQKINGPFTALLNPQDYWRMRYARKDTTNNYIFQAPSLSPLNQPMQADGVAIMENNSVTAGTFFVFANNAAQIFDRAGVVVRFYDQDQDNAIKNLITIVIEERLALVIYRPLGIIRGVLATVITGLAT